MLDSMVFLWTDILIFFLLFLVIGFALYARRYEHLRAPWRQVLRRPVAMSCMVILLFYVLIALLDSIHFHPAIENTKENGAKHSLEVVSVFDRLVSTLKEHEEKTYSAPLATTLFTMESIETPDGKTIRDYPRLLYGGAHLTDPKEQGNDILALMSVGAVKAILVWSVFAGLAFLAFKRANKLKNNISVKAFLTGKTRIPWHVGLWTLLVILIMLFVAAEISQRYHLFGTNKVGEDVLYQALKSIRTGLLLGTLTTLVMLPAAILLGIMAGYFKGWVDDVIQYSYTTLNSIPSVLLIAAAVLMLHIYMNNHADEFNSLVERADMRLLFLCLILGVTSWTGLCRLLRGESLKLRELDYVQAAEAFGVSHFVIIFRHIFPNVLHIVLITVVLDFSGLVLAEAVLSYINIGVDPSMNSWGNMINSARLEMAREPVVWWSLAAAFIFMFVLVLAANLFADVVRDAFDPRLRNQR